MVPRTKSLQQIPTKLNECFPIHSTFCCQPQYSQIFPIFLPYKVSWALGKGHTSVVGSEKSQLGSFPLKRTPPDIFTRRSGLVQHFPSEHLEFDGVAINQCIGGVWRNGVRSQALVSYPRGRRFKPKPVQLTFFSVCVRVCVCVYGSCLYIDCSPTALGGAGLPPKHLGVIGAKPKTNGEGGAEQP